MEGLESLLNNLLTRQVGMSVHEDPFKNSMNYYGILNTPQAQIYGPPIPIEQKFLNVPLEGSAEEIPPEYTYPNLKEQYFNKNYLNNQLDPIKKQSEPIKIGDIQFTPNVNYSTGETSYGIPGLRSKLINSYFGGNINYPFGDTGLSLQGTYGKITNIENRQYRDYPSEKYVSTQNPFDFGIKFNMDF